MGGAWTRRGALALLAAATAARGRAAGGATAPGTLGLSVGFDALRWQRDAALAGELDAYAAAGVRWLRTDLDWSAVQPEGPERFDWTPFDRIARGAAARGIAVLPIPNRTPAWARTDPAAPSPPADPGAFAAFVEGAVRRYRPLGLRHWEIWNEPNLAAFWPPSPDARAYAAVLRAAAGAVRGADAGATVILGGLAAVQETGPIPSPPRRMRHRAAVGFLEDVYRHAGADAFDAVGFHPYSHPAPPDMAGLLNGWSLMARGVRGVMARHGDAGKPVWITEYGAPTVPARGGVSLAEQADFLEGAHALAAATPWAGPLFWYSWADLGTDEDDPEHWFGLLRGDGTPKPAHRRFRALAGG